MAATAGKQHQHEAPYARKRDHPQFDGMRRSDSTKPARRNRHVSPPEGANKSDLSRSLSDIWEFESKQTPPGIADFGVAAASHEAIELEDAMPVHEGDAETSSVGQRNVVVHKSLVSQCAAAYYRGDLLQIDAPISCKSMDKLNRYLAACKDEIRAGVPGRFLQAVLSHDIMDVGCFVCTIMYAFYLSHTRKDGQVCMVPVISMKRADFAARSELKWLVRSCGMDESNLIFIDEAGLSYHHQFGNLKIVLVNGNQLPAKQEGLKDAVVEIFYCKAVDPQYISAEEITMAQNCSCCALISEMFAETSPGILAGQGFCRLLLAGILMDTANLTAASCTSKDKYMSTLLLKGAGRFGCSGLYELLKRKMHDISDLKVKEMLRREFKRWFRVTGKPGSRGSRLTTSHVGMSSIGISLEELVAREDSAVEEIIRFQESEKLQLFVIVSGYYDERNNFKREILVSANTAELMRSFYRYLDINGTRLPIKALDRLGLKEELKAFEIDNTLTSRRAIERLLQDFGGVQRRN